MTAAAPAAVRAACETHVGRVRTTNEDSTIFEPHVGLYAVLDGMGGANAGDVASMIARDTLRDHVLQRWLNTEPRALLVGAIQAACHAVWSAANAVRERHGMGTTVVACLMIDPKRAVIAHVGDSRAYVLRDGRLQALTRDHTIVEELVGRGMLTADEAERHPYKNVLSRNLGARAETRVDVAEVELRAGDRLLLCSDGLYGYASSEAIQYLLGSGDAPEHVARDLVELALRGGGGDNVSTIVIEGPALPPSGAQVVRTNGSAAWWQRRQRFVQVARERGLTQNPICAGLPPDDAIEVIAMSLCEAIYHDLEKSTGVNVWTFAQNLAGGWFAQNGAWTPLRGMIDILAMSARMVVDEVRASDRDLGFLLDVAVSRALVVAELALGGLLSERLRNVDEDLIHMHAAAKDTLDVVDETEPQFLEQATMPFMRPDRPVTHSGVSADLITGIESTITIARARTAPRAELVKSMLVAIEQLASDSSGNFAAAIVAARDIYGVRTVDDAGIGSLFDALDQARILTTASVHQISASESVRAKVLAALSTAHQRLAGALTGLVLEAVAPFSERLRTAQELTVGLRDQVGEAERRRSELEAKFASTVDHSQPWERRGSTEW